MFMHFYMSLHSLEESCDTMPISLILVKKEEDNSETLIGHAQISLIPDIPNGSFIKTGK